MGLSVATLNGSRLTRARINLPKWGCWYTDLSVDGEIAIAAGAKATVVVADLTLVGAVLSGGSELGRSSYRIVAGAGGWGKTLPRKSYSNDAGVKLATVLGDAAKEAGETLSPISALQRVGPAYDRDEGPASRALELLVPRAWYVDEAGVTRLGARGTSTLPAGVTRVAPVDRARGKVVLASEAIAAILPGVVVDGMAAVDVLHEISAEGGLRSTVWGSASPSTLDSLSALARQLDPDRDYRGISEYRVVTQDGDRVNLQPVRASTGKPDLRRVPVRSGVAGAKSTLTPGCRVLVSFVDSDPGRPVVVGLEDTDGEGFTPLMTEIDASTFIRLGAGAKPAIAAGDLAGIFPCIPTQAKVLI
jgi:hypothetical protein